MRPSPRGLLVSSSLPIGDGSFEQVVEQRTEEGGFLGFPSKFPFSGGLCISHLLFVDDTIIFCDATGEQLLYIRMVMIFFKVITGLKVNIGKSEIVPMGVIRSLKTLSSVLSCDVSKLTMT